MFIDETRDIINEFVDNSVTEDYLESLLLPKREKILESNRKSNAYLGGGLVGLLLLIIHHR